MGRLSSSTLVPGPRRALSHLLPHHHRDDNMDRASKVLAQGVRNIASHCRTRHARCHGVTITLTDSVINKVIVEIG